jgi:hypothetical protein
VLFLALGQFFMRQMDQPATLWTGLAFYGLALFFLLKLDQLENKPRPAEGLSVRAEIFSLVILFGIALFFRVYKIHDFPNGVQEDRAVSALGSLRILYENWRPGIQETYATQISDLSIHYLLALWFKLFGITPEVFSFFDVFISLAAFPLIYWFFRQLSGPKTALATLAFLAVMRWHFHLGRGVNIHIEEILIWIFATLACWLYALRTNHRWAFWAGAFFLAWGLYGYSGYKGFLLVFGAVLAYEFRANRKIFQKNSPVLLGALFIFVLTAAPLLDFMVQNQSLGRREGEVSILVEVKQQKSFYPLFRNFAQAACMFNRKDIRSAQFNIGDHPILDDLTGVLLVLGLAVALRKAQEKKFFYGLAGFIGMLLPAIFSLNGAHPGRAFGASPFAAFLAAEGGGFLYGLFQRSGFPRFFTPWLAGAAFLAVAGLNFNDYFNHQALDKVCLSDYCAVETAIGKTIRDYGKDYDCFVSSWNAGRPTVQYLSYFQRDRIKPIHWPGDLGPFSTISGRGRLFILDETEEGQWELLKSLYPGGDEGFYQDIEGHVVNYSYRIPPALVDGARNLRSADSGRKKRGSFFADRPGLYHFRWGREKVRLTMGTQPVLNGNGIQLAKGFHPIQIEWTDRLGSLQVLPEVSSPSGGWESMGPACLVSLEVPKGLLGQYFYSPNGIEKPFLEEWDPVIDFHALDFPATASSLYIHWKGRFRAPSAGLYEWKAFTYPSERAQIQVDGKDLTPPMESPEGSASLAEGWHPFELKYQNHPNLFSALVLLWKKPGDTRYQVMPNEVFDISR